MQHNKLYGNDSENVLYFIFFVEFENHNLNVFFSLLIVLNLCETQLIISCVVRVAKKKVCEKETHTSALKCQVQSQLMNSNANGKYSMIYIHVIHLHNN